MNLKPIGACPVCGKARGGRGHRACSRQLQQTAKPARAAKNSPKLLDALARHLATQ